MTPQRVRPMGMLLALLLGVAGGAVFHFFELPLAWMLGAMCFATVAAVAGVPIDFYTPLRSGMISVLGALLGSAFTPDVLDRLLHWAGGALLVTGYVACATAVVALLYRRVARLDPVTSFFSATPGGLGEMTLLGELHGGSPRVIPMAHAIRVLMLVFAIPFLMVLVLGLEVPGTAAGNGGRPVADARELAILAACGGAGYLVARLLRIPSARLLGPLVFSAAAYMLGWIEGRPPPALVALAQIVVGTAVGARFVGLQWHEVKRPGAIALLSGVVMVALATGIAFLAEPWLGYSAAALVLALAPGGLAEMSLIALALDIDTAFVSTMHIVRIMLIVLCAPILFRLLRIGGKAARRP